MLKNLLLVFVLLFGILAYEINFYEFYMVFSLLFVILLTVFNILFKNYQFIWNTSVSWKIFIVLFLLSYLPSLIFNFDIIGVGRFLGMMYISFISVYSIKEIDTILEILLYLLIVVLGMAYLIQFTVILIPVWGLVYERNASIFFDPNFASVFLGLGCFLSLIYLRNILIKIIISSLFAGGVFFTYSKAGIFALFIGYLSYFFITFNKKALLYLLGAILLVFVNYIFDILRLLGNLDLSMFRFEQGLNERDNLWQFSIDLIIKSQNFFGIGAKNLVVYLKQNGFANVSTHNFYFDTLLSYGVLVFFMHIILTVLILLKMSMRRSKYLPLFLVLVINANSILISFGGFGLLSVLLTLIIVNEIVVGIKR